MKVERHDFQNIFSSREIAIIMPKEPLDMLSHHDIARWWDECWTSEMEMAPWGKAVSGLTAEQAAWKPAGGHHSIWEIVLHMTYWREYELGKANGKTRDEEEIARRNWGTIEDISKSAWVFHRKTSVP